MLTVSQITAIAQGGHPGASLFVNWCFNDRHSMGGDSGTSGQNLTMGGGRPGAGVSSTCGGTPGPTMAPTDQPTTAQPTATPTLFPTLQPTFHPCLTLHHGCDPLSTYCAAVVNGGNAFTCECRFGFSPSPTSITVCVITATPTATPTTAAPTQNPTAYPTTSPSAAPSTNPTARPTDSQSPTPAPVATSASSGSGSSSDSTSPLLIIVVVLVAIVIIAVIVGVAVTRKSPGAAESRPAAVVAFENPMCVIGGGHRSRAISAVSRPHLLSFADSPPLTYARCSTSRTPS